MEMNVFIFFAAALVPMVTGFIWYNPKVMGTVWMNASGMTEEKMKGANMGLIFGLSYVLSLLLAFGLSGIVIHQFGVFSLVGGDAALFSSGTAAAFMGEYGEHFRTFKHGVLHGVIAGIAIALPILGTNALFERKGFKYIAVNVGYWIITMGLMGGVLCQWL